MSRNFSTLLVLVATLLAMCLSMVAAAPLTLKQLQNAASGRCPTRTHGEVISCKDALPYINAAITKYKLTTKGQKAAYIANMFYEGGYLTYNHNLNTHSQGTRSIMPAVSLRTYLNANKDVATKLYPSFPKGVDNSKIVDALIKKHYDFYPGAWWAKSGPGCAKTAAKLNASQATFLAWEKACINGGDVNTRAAVYKKVYAAL